METQPLDALFTSIPTEGLIIAVEGPVGVGKSSLCAVLSTEAYIRNIPFVMLEEPIDFDQLFIMLSDPRQWAFRVQMSFLSKRSAAYNHAINTNPGRLIILDRCHIGDRVFEEYYRRLGYITEEQHEVYMKDYNAWVYSDTFKSPDIILNVGAPLAAIKDRVKLRSEEHEERASEASYDDIFHAGIGEIYKDFMPIGAKPLWNTHTDRNKYAHLKELLAESLK